MRGGAIGTPLMVKATNPGRMPPGWFSDPALAGGGATMDHTVHVADMLRWIFEREIVSVYAEIDARIHPGLPTDDIGLLLLDLDGGLSASLDASWSRAKTWPTWGGVTMEVIGTNGVLALDAFNQNVQLFDDRDRPVSSRPLHRRRRSRSCPRVHRGGAQGDAASRHRRRRPARPRSRPLRVRVGAAGRAGRLPGGAAPLS